MVDTPNSSKSFNEMVDYHKLAMALNNRPDLIAKGIYLNPEDEAVLAEEGKKKLDANNNSPITNDAGAMVTNGLSYVFTLLQNFLSGINFGNLGGSLSNIFKVTSEESDLNKLNNATVELNQALKAKGGKFAAIADLVTGQTEGPGKPEWFNEGIYEQARQSIALPIGTNATSLDNNGVGAQMPSLAPLTPAGAPKSTRSLT